MNVFLFVKGLAQARDREAGGLGGVDDHLFTAREQGCSSRNLVDCIRRHDDCAMAVGVDDVVRRYDHAGDADRAGVIDEMDMRMGRHDRPGENQKIGRHRIEIADRAVVMTPAQPSPLWIWLCTSPQNAPKPISGASISWMTAILGSGSAAICA